MRRLVCTFVIRIWHKQDFSWRGSFHTTHTTTTDERKLPVSSPINASAEVSSKRWLIIGTWRLHFWWINLHLLGHIYLSSWLSTCAVLLDDIAIVCIYFPYWCLGPDVEFECIRSDVKCCATMQKLTGILFVDQKKWCSFLQTLTYYTSFYQTQNSEHAYKQFINIRLNIVSDLLPETYALTSKCHVPCYAKHHSPVVKRRYFRRAWAKFLAIFDNHSINCIV